MAGKVETAGGFFLTRWVRRLYQWMMRWAETPHAEKALGAVSFADSSFFPIPPDVMLIPMSIARPDRAIRFGIITSVTSVLGAMFGYLIGYLFFDTIGIKIIEFYGLMDKYWTFREWFEKYNFAIIMVAGLTPLPYKVFTITAGVAAVNFPIFLLGSTLSRSTRFMTEAVVCYYGDFFSKKIFRMPIREALDRYINLFGILMAVLGVAGFLVVKWALPGAETHVCREIKSDAALPAEVCLWSVPEPEDKTLIQYRLGLGLDGDAVEEIIPGGPLPKPSRGEPELYLLEPAPERRQIAAVVYYDLPGDERGVNGKIAFYQLRDDRLSYLDQIEFPRYRLGERGAWSEGRVEVRTENRDREPDLEIVVLIETIHYVGARGGETLSEKTELVFKLGDKLLKIEYNDLKWEPADRGE